FDGEKRPGAKSTHTRSLRPGAASSLIRTLGRDLRATTVGSGIGPDLLTLRMAGGARGLAPVPLPGTAPTAGGEFHPALKTFGSVLAAGQAGGGILPPCPPGPAATAGRSVAARSVPGRAQQQAAVLAHHHRIDQLQAQALGHGL